ncbi:hypothetical protein QBK99_12670 [Corticibacterium sp. UT-5YL-CI-8]|nr:hypothetical protein [Tianweitania sp. UT-5YL-CI-8]
MAGIFDAFKTAFREYVVDGVPSSGKQEPRKQDIQPIGQLIDTQIDEVRTIALAGARSPVTVRLIINTNVDLTAGLIAGTVIQSVTLADGDIVLPVGQAAGATTTDAYGSTNSPDNGPRVVGAGAAARHPDYNEGTELVGAQFAAAAGTQTGWVYAVRGQPVIGTDPISITRAFPTNETPDGTITPPKLAPQAQGTATYRRPGAGTGSPTVNSLTQLVDDIGLTGVASDNAGLKAAVFPVVQTVRGYRDIIVDEPGAFVLQGIADDNSVEDFLDEPDPTEVDAVFNSRLWSDIELDESEEYVVEAVSLDGSEMLIGLDPTQEDFEQISSAAVAEVFVPHPARANKSNVIEGAIHNQWIRSVRQIGNTVYIGGIGESRMSPPGRKDAPLWITELLIGLRSSTSHLIGWDHQRDDHNSTFALPDGLWSTDLPFPSYRPPDVPLMVFQRQHGGGGRGYNHWKGKSISAAGLGKREQLLGTYDNLTYGQIFRRPSLPRQVHLLMRHDVEGARNWAIARSLENVEDGLPLFHDVFAGSVGSDMYSNWWPKDNGSGAQFFFHNHPANSFERRLFMCSMDWAGPIWSYAAGGPGTPISNPFVGGAVVDPRGGQLDVIYTPPGTDRVRMWDIGEVAPNKYMVVHGRFTGPPSISTDWDASLTEAFTVDVSSGSPVISTPKFVCGGGRYLKASNAYQAGASIFRENIVAACQIEYDPVGDPGKSRFAVWDVSGSSPVKVPFIFGFDENDAPIILEEYISDQMLARPVTAVRDLWQEDGTVKYTQGDVVVFCEISSYPDYDADYRSNQRWAIPLVPGNSLV